jgi:hypothetical protein
VVPTGGFDFLAFHFFLDAVVNDRLLFDFPHNVAGLFIFSQPARWWFYKLHVSEIQHGTNETHTGSRIGLRCCSNLGALFVGLGYGYARDRRPSHPNRADVWL